MYKSACMCLCTVWPLSVNVESSAEAYGKPQPSPRQSTIGAHSQEKPSETFCQSVFNLIFPIKDSSTLYFLLVLVHMSTEAVLSVILYTKM